jgi:hypothetical protein
VKHFSANGVGVHSVIDRSLKSAVEAGEWFSLHTSPSGALNALDVA